MEIVRRIPPYLLGAVLTIGAGPPETGHILLPQRPMKKPMTPPRSSRTTAFIAVQTQQLQWIPQHFFSSGLLS